MAHIAALRTQNYDKFTAKNDVKRFDWLKNVWVIYELEFEFWPVKCSI